MKLFYPHIYKTAGQSLIAAIRAHVKPEKCIDVTAEGDRSKFLTMSDEQKKSFDFVYGHVDVGFCPGLFPEFKIVTFLRDPIARAVSHYNYAMTEKSDPGHRMMQEANWSFDQFIDHHMDDWNGNLQTRVLAGTAWSDQSVTSEKSLDLALKNLNQSLMVGVLEYFDVGIACLASQTEWDIKYSHRNPTINKRVLVVSDEQRQKLYRRTWADQILYRKAFERLIGQISGVYPSNPA